MSRPITDIIREINHGQFAEEITEHLAALVPAAREAGTKASISITLALKPGKRGSNVVEIVPSYKVVPPKTEVPTEIFFATADGALVRDNPDQKKLDLVQVRGQQPDPVLVVTRPGQVPVRQLVDPDTGEIVHVSAAAPPPPAPPQSPPDDSDDDAASVA